MGELEPRLRGMEGAKELTLPEHPLGTGRVRRQHGASNNGQARREILPLASLTRSPCLRDVRVLTQGHPAHEGDCWDVNLDIYMSTPAALAAPKWARALGVTLNSSRSELCKRAGGPEEAASS